MLLDTIINLFIWLFVKQFIMRCGCLIHIVNVMVLGLVLACLSMPWHALSCSSKFLMIIWSSVACKGCCVMTMPHCCSSLCLCDTKICTGACFCLLKHLLMLAMIHWIISKAWCMVYLLISFICVALFDLVDKWCELLSSNDHIDWFSEARGMPTIVGDPSSLWTHLGNDAVAWCVVFWVWGGPDSLLMLSKGSSPSLWLAVVGECITG